MTAFATLRTHAFAPANDAIAVLASLLIEIESSPEEAAIALIAEFGSVGATLSGSPYRIGNIRSKKIAETLCRVDNAMRFALREKISSSPVIGNWTALLDHLRFDLRHRTVEQFRVLHLTTKNMLICDEVMSEGTIDRAPVYVREVIRRAIDLGSAAVILVHNHPSGDPTPSKEDIEITRTLMIACEVFCISVHDHVIIAGADHSSLRAKGLM